MNSLFNTGLILHISGISLMVGMTIASFVVYKRVWQLLSEEKDKAQLLVDTIGLLSRLQLLGGVLIITGGTLMMFVFHGVFMHQVWFKIKLVLLLLLIVNTILTSQPAAKRLHRFVAADQSGSETLDGVRQMINRFHALQLLIFLCIIILSVFRFN